MAAHKRIGRRAFLGAGLAAGAALGTGWRMRRARAGDYRYNGLVPWTGNPETESRLTVADPSRIRLLQVTDVHFYREWHKPAVDQHTVDDFKRYVDRYEPDAVMVSGDFWHDNPNGKGAEFMAFAIEQMEALGVPWLFTWGNHDQLDDYTVGHAAMTNAKRSLYRGGPGGGCYTVAITDRQGETRWDLFCLNSMHDGFQAPQRNWLRDEQLRRAHEPGAPHAFAVHHIPVKQYNDIWENSSASGVKFEEVCSWGEDGSSFAYLKALGTVRACFVGHEHVNNYGGVHEGIELVYGRATGHGGYGADKVPKGATLITANAGTGAYTWQTVYPGGGTWVPEPGRQIDVYRDGLWEDA